MMYGGHGLSGLGYRDRGVVGIGFGQGLEIGTRMVLRGCRLVSRSVWRADCIGVRSEWGWSYGRSWGNWVVWGCGILEGWICVVTGLCERGVWRWQKGGCVDCGGGKGCGSREISSYIIYLFILIIILWKTFILFYFIFLPLEIRLI
jgi:hypothetical protein